MKIVNQINRGLVKNLAAQTDAIGSTYTRLSTGQRINKASDDAAGLSMMLTTDAQIRISNQAKRNLNDGISLAQVADSAIEQLSNIINRISELATQAANGAYSHGQRSALNSESQALLSEYTRIVETTKYNGVSVLAEAASTVLQGGLGTQNTLTINTGIGTGVVVTESVGTGQYAAATTYAGVSTGNNFVTDDLNGDGYDDLIYIDGPLSVRLSNGSGGYNAAQTYATGGNGTGHGTTGDLDNDGDLDLVVSNLSDSEIGVYINNGSGVFAAVVNYNSSTSAEEVAIGDFNEDGNLDIIAAGGANSNFSIHFGNGNGTFGAEVSGNDQDGASRSLKTADLDGDGYLDLVFGRDNSDDEINIYFGNGSGSFASQITISIAANDPEIELTDINGDSRLDIVVVTPTSLSVLANQGSRTFSESNLTVLTDAGGIDTGDYNGDGMYDVLVAGDTGNAAYLYTGSANGTLSLTSTLSNPGNDVDFVQFGNVNNDGVLDVFFYSDDNDLASTLIGESAIVTHSINLLSTVDISTRTGALAAVDDLKTVRDYLSTKRGDLGASLSRASTFLSQLTNHELELNRAKSRIADVDIASESASLIMNQVLQKSSTALLAQAAKLQNIDLKLLIN